MPPKAVPPASTTTATSSSSSSSTTAISSSSSSSLNNNNNDNAATIVISQHLLLQDLQDDNNFFDFVVDMIPAKLYVSGQSGDDYNPKYFKGQAKESKEARRAQNKQAKRAKLDPTLSERTTQTKERLEGKGGAPKKVVLSKPAKQQQQKQKQQKKQQNNFKEQQKLEKQDKSNMTDSSSATTATTAVATTTGQSRIEALRAKLHAKLAEKRSQRPSDPQAVSKRAARRAEKKRRQEEAAALKNKKAAHTSAEKNKNNKTYSIKPTSALTAASIDAAQDLETIDFGPLAGLNVNNSNALKGISSSKDHYIKANKSLANLSKTKNLEKMLADAEQKKQKLEQLKKGDEEDKQKARNIEWGDAIKEAAGDRVKEDPAKLKKAIKRKAAQKTKSAKAWKSRMDQTKSKMDDRQAIRSHNLNKRKLGGKAGANLSRKRIVDENNTTNNNNDKTKGDAATGGRQSRPGFEGRRQKFLNEKKE